MPRLSRLRWWPGLCPDPSGGAYDAPPDAIVGWEGDTPKDLTRKDSVSVTFALIHLPSVLAARRLQHLVSSLWAPIFLAINHREVDFHYAVFTLLKYL